MAFWAGAAGPIAGAFLGGAFEAFAAPGKRAAFADAMRFQEAMQNAALQAKREGLYADLGNQLSARVASLGWGADLDKARQEAAITKGLQEHEPTRQGLAEQALSRQRAFDLDPRSRQLAALYRKGEMEKEMVRAGAPGAFTFGITQGTAPLFAGKYGLLA